MTRVLVVDDEPPIVRAVAANLRVRGFEVLTAASGEAALTAVETHQPDCVVLDLGLPGIDGLEVLRRLRTWTQVPVVVLTAIDGERDKVTALDLGADDYVTKPFGVAELMARIRVALRHARAAGADRPRVITAGDVAIDLDAKLVTRGGTAVRLTPTEYRLVETLATNAGRLCTHRFLLERVWGPGYGDESQYLRVYMANLRKKLDDPCGPAAAADRARHGLPVRRPRPRRRRRGGLSVRVVVVGCGRVGAGLAAGLAAAGDVVAVVDKDPKAFERLGEEFTGQTVEGIGFDRDVLEQAGVARADALVAVTGGDNSNVVAARVARDAYRVPRVIARIHDPRRAALYEELGVVTVSSTGWALRKVRDYLEHRTLKEEHSFGRGEVTLLRLELPQHLVDRPVADLEGEGLRVVSVTRRGGAFVPGPGTVLAEGDVVRLAVGAGGRERLDALLAEEADPRAGRPGGGRVRVLVAGAGVWGSYIADHLVEAGHEVAVVEQDAATARRARATGGRTVVAGDACEPSVLDRLGLDTVDTVVAATGDDEDNLVVSLLVKRWYAVPRVVARVNNPKNTWMFTDEWGVDTAVSAPAVMTWLLERAVGVQDVVALLRAERGRGVALVELTLDEDAPVLGRRPAELDLPTGATVVAVVRGDQVLAGADAGPFEPADEVLALTTLQAEPDLRLLLGGQPGGSHTPAG